MSSASLYAAALEGVLARAGSLDPDCIGVGQALAVVPERAA